MSHSVCPSSALLRFFTLALVGLAALRAHAQTVINYDALPACAQNCVPLKTAQDGCVPPAAQVTNQETYVSCFCQSAFLTQFYQGSAAICSSACTSPADQTSIQQWYVNYCRTGQGGVVSSATSNAPTASTATPSVGSSMTNTVINDPDGDGDPSNNYTGSWISAHWKWVVMLAVIFLAMTFFSLLGLYLKKRHRAKRDALRANFAAPDAAIGPLPPPPPMVHMKNGNDSGTLASTIDLSATAAGATPSKSRSRSNTLTRFPNGSMSNLAPVPPSHVVWGPHQHQAATRGYEYHMSGSPGPSVPSTPVSIPTPSMTPVGSYNRYSGTSNGKSRSNEVINEVADEDRIEYVGAKDRLKMKLSKR